MKNKIDQLISQAESIVITSHTNPDPDAVCSALAFFDYLKKAHPDKRVKIIFGSPPFEGYRFLKHYRQANWVDELTDHLDGIDLLVCLDGNKCDRFTTRPEIIRQGKFKTLCLDHHPGQADCFDLSFIDPAVGASCQLLADLIFADDKYLDKNVIEILLTGILSDTGNLEWVSFETSSVLTTVKRLVDLGRIHLQSLIAKADSISLEEFQVAKTMINHTNNVKIGRSPLLTYGYLTKKDVSQFKWESVSNGYHRYLTMVVRRLANHPWGFAVIPDLRLREFKISLRSTPGNPHVGELAQKHFGGGGQKFAAGGKVTLAKAFNQTSSENACQKALSVLKSIKNIPLTENG